MKEEYEGTLKRHVQFIQQLVDEKKKLSEKSEALASEMHQQASRHLHERRVNDERHTNEIRRIKQVPAHFHLPADWEFWLQNPSRISKNP